MTRQVWRMAAPLAALVVAGLAPAGWTQGISWQQRNATLQEAANALSAATGYDVSVQRSGLPAEGQRAEVAWEGRSLFEVSRELAALYQCQVRGVGERRLFLADPPEEPVAETVVGPYRISAPAVTTGMDGQRQFTLTVEAENELDLEALAGVGPRWQALDSFSRGVPIANQPEHEQIFTSLYRRFPTEWQYGVRLDVPDNVSPRLRELTGELLAYTRVRPVRFEFDLLDPAAERSASAEGVEVRLEEFGRDRRYYVVRLRTSWPGEAELIGRGLSRSLSPYLVDADGRLRRVMDDRSEIVEDRGGRSISQQRLEFAISSDQPRTLVLEALLREPPVRSLQFRLQDVPLTAHGWVRRPGPSALFDPEGGTLEARLALPPEIAGDGELSLGLSRRLEERWDAWRWLDVTLDSEGRVRLEGLRAGEYRLLWRYRVRSGPSVGARTPVTATVEPGKVIFLRLEPDRS